MEFIKFFEKQWKLLIGVLLAGAIAGAVFVLVSTQSLNKEKLAQENYFIVEKNLLELKEKQTTAKVGVDFSQSKKDLEKIISDYPGSVAAQMAAIHYAKLLADEKNFDAALSVLQKAENKDKGMVNTLVQQQIGQLLADKNECLRAIEVWQKIINRKEAAFIHGETKIQQALCYAKLNDLKKAEEILTKLANQSSSINSETAADHSVKEAEKYLRLIQFKKASGS